MTYKERMVKAAIKILAEMYDVPQKELKVGGSRIQNIMEARRLLMFYLNRFMGVKHVEMKKYIKDVHHANSIHHCNKMEWFLIYDERVKEEYKEFLLRMGEHDVLNQVIQHKIERVVTLQSEINDYLKQIKK